jgi:dihydrolipoamide dehydrogenase
MLSHVAMVMGEVAAVNRAGGNAVFDEKTSPSCAYVSPEFAGVGLTEEAPGRRASTTRSAGSPWRPREIPDRRRHRRMIKVLADKKYNEILGSYGRPEGHGYDPRGGAGDSAGVHHRGIREHDPLPPTVSEAMREAMLAVDQKAIHI